MSELYVINPTVIPEETKLRVAAYVRVSTDDEDQENSFISQFDYYSRYLKENPQLEFVDMYADEGITGTEMKKRDEFNRMVEDCQEGRIDLVITKSISRFARNTYECIKTVRELKQYGVDLYFEKEEIDTRKMKSETELTMLSAMAQEESISISKNVKLGIVHKMMDGTYHYGAVPYGYKKVGTKMVIVEEQAKYIRRIFREYVNGKTTGEIAAKLTLENIPKSDGSTKWSTSGIRYILTNVTYKGDVILQKSYSDGFPFKTKINHGELNQYYIQDYCPAIVSKKIFDEANLLFEMRKPKAENTESDKMKETSFQKLLFCYECGKLLTRKHYNETWSCTLHSKRGSDKQISSIPEKKIKEGFTICYNKLYANIDSILVTTINLTQEYKSIQNSSNVKIDEINNRIAQITEQILIIERLKANECIESAIYMEKSRELTNEISNLKKQKKYLSGNNLCDNFIKLTTRIIKILETAGPLGTFDEDVFKALVKKVYVDKVAIRYELINAMVLKINREEV